MGSFTFSLLRFLFLLFLLNSLHKSSAFQRPKQSNHFHIVELNSLLAASTCNRNTTDSTPEEYLELVHKYGPCSKSKHGKAKAPNVRKILEGDQTRPNLKQHRKNQIGVKWDGGINQEYVVNVGLGTPKRVFTLMMDTGSSLLWTQCQPCKLGRQGCDKQIHPYFDPSKSSTYANITCPTHTCSQANTTLGFTTCISSTCLYEAAYVDGSGVAGFLAKERLSVGYDTFNDIIFGCIEANINNTLVDVDGIIGLGQDYVSFLEQTTQTYHRVFSYCLPTKTSDIGFLKFGKSKTVSNSLMYTQLGSGYAIPLVGIILGGTKLPIAFKKGAASIDSGSSISALPSKDYITLRDAYRKAMPHYRLVKPPKDYEILDTCYFVDDHRKLKFPKMSFLFKDGLVLDIPHVGIAFPVNSTVVCLPFTVIPGGGDDVLFGNAQQKTLEIVYDVAGGKIGFGYDGCK
ncbi:aspartyl protease family protein At5g10770-like [Abrus precatorius]|uniref:Aspartyl protease family protein At5g10770-like n=1 Tax=Abrus precatorius TaxID=3816 RepID=A0A8B8K348_ABRPR|nr:aspartyl protease family protein At5g10770-like [Abrus precatorius]